MSRSEIMGTGAVALVLTGATGAGIRWGLGVSGSAWEWIWLIGIIGLPTWAATWNLVKWSRRGLVQMGHDVGEGVVNLVMWLIYAVLTVIALGLVYVTFRVLLKVAIWGLT